MAKEKEAKPEKENPVIAWINRLVDNHTITAQVGEVLKREAASLK